MKKKMYIIPFLIIAIMVLFVSCNNSDNNETNNRETEMVTQTETATADSSIETIETESDSLDTTQTDETQVTTKYFYDMDPTIMHQPTEEKMELIHKGMSFMDVYEIIGAPHMLDPDDYNGYGLVWVADNGDSYCLQFSLNGADKDSFKSYVELYSNLTLDKEPYIVKTRFRYETSSKTASYTIDGVDYYQLYNHSDYYITIPYASVDDVRKVYKIIDGQPIDVTDNCVFFNDFLDVNIEHQPTIEDILMIQEGMTYKEIEAIIGRPHKCDPNLIDCYIWVTSEGNEYLLNLKSESIGKAICYSYTEYMNTTVLTYKVRRTKTCFLYEPELDTFMSASEATCTIDGVSYYQIEKHSNYYLTEPSANVVLGSRVYRFIDGQPVDVTEDCDWSGTIFLKNWQVKYD
jgi:outer membrane protein assembly factor BamE (lipoprotein component of BamABCDE complex)